MSCVVLQTLWTGAMCMFRSGYSGPNTCTGCHRSARCFRSWPAEICAPWQKQTSDSAPRSMETCCTLIWTSGDLVRRTGTLGNEPRSRLIVNCTANAVWLNANLRFGFKYSVWCKLQHDCFFFFFCLFLQLRQWRRAAHQRTANQVFIYFLVIKIMRHKVKGKKNISFKKKSLLC